MSALNDELQDAYTDSLKFVAALHDKRPNAVRGDAELSAAVWAEMLATLAYRPRIAEILAAWFAPVPCAREGCVNDADSNVRHPHDEARAFCADPCKQWVRREEARERRARREAERLAAV